MTYALWIIQILLHIKPWLTPLAAGGEAGAAYGACVQSEIST